MPLLNQPIIKEYVAELQKQKAELMGGGDPEAVEQKYMTLAGKGTAKDLKEAWGQTKISPRLLTRALEVQNDKNLPSSFYQTQVDALILFKKMKDMAQDQLNMQQALNADTKGLRGVTLVDAAKQIDDYNRASAPLILNSDQLKDSMLTNFKLGYNYMLKPINDLFNKGEVYMFSELKPAFRFMRRLGSTGKSKPAKVNTAIKQFILSDPELYRPILERIGLKQKTITPAMVRDRVMKEHFDVLEDGTVTKDNRQPSLATLIDKYNHEVTAEGMTVRSVYEILANVRPMPQMGNDLISMVQYANVNNYKQNLDVLLPASVMNLLRSDNPELQLIGNYFIMYAYMAGGTDSPTSFIRAIPLEELVHTGFGEKLRNRMAQLDMEFAGLENEIRDASRTTEWREDSRGYVTKLMSGDYVKINRRAIGTLRAFAKQYAQHHWYEYLNLSELLEEVSPGVYTAKGDLKPEDLSRLNQHATYTTKIEKTCR
jgi:hypothetical protein